MGRPLNKKYFGNRNIGSTATTDNGIGGEGVASVTIAGTNNNYIAVPTATFANNVVANTLTANVVTANVTTSTISLSGTWTPNVYFTTANGITYTSNVGNWIKTGKMVHAYFSISATTSGASGNMFIGGLPFPSLTGSGPVGFTQVGGLLSGPSAGNMGPMSGNVIAGSTSSQLYVFVNGGNGNLTNEPVAAGTGTGGIGTTFTINGSITYSANT